MARFSCVVKPAAFLLAAALVCAVGGCKPGGETSRVSEVSGGVSSANMPTGPEVTEPSQSADSSTTPGSSDSQSKKPMGGTTKVQEPGKTTAEKATTTSTEGVTTSPSAATSSYVTGDKYGVHDTLLTYICSDGISNRLSKKRLLSSIAYIKDGQIKDTLFDSFVILPSPNYLYNYGAADWGMKPLTKADWLNYITNEQFAKDVNVDAIDAAVGETKQALGRSDYKATIFMSLFYPVKSVTSFGEVNGKNLNLNNIADRKAAVKWMVDEQIRQFTARNYQNLRLGGFYWFPEAIEPTDMEVAEILKDVTDYVRSKNCITTWIPYHGAPGYDKAHELGFDLACMQANYFGDGAPNAGGKERLAKTDTLIKKRKLGFCIELGGGDKKAIAILKDYLSVGAELGYINAYHMYYLGGGPNEVEKMANSAKPEIRSGYDELYKFIKKAL